MISLLSHSCYYFLELPSFQDPGTFYLLIYYYYYYLYYYYIIFIIIILLLLFKEMVLNPGLQECHMTLLGHPSTGSTVTVAHRP